MNRKQAKEAKQVALTEKLRQQAAESETKGIPVSFPKAPVRLREAMEKFRKVDLTVPSDASKRNET